MKDSMELLKELISLRPVSADVERVNQATEVLHAYLAGEGLHCTLEQVGNLAVLYAATMPGKTPDVLLNAHVDVVPAEDHQFTPVERDGQLVARGTSDCLGNTVICAQTLIRCAGKASVGAVFSADEELGGATTKAMVERGYVGKKLILVMDGTHDAVTTAQKGILSLRLEAEGQAAHASTPWQGQNAIDKLIAGYERIRPLFPAVQAGDEWHDTMVASIIEGGTVSNRVPDKASLTLNIRYTDVTRREPIVEAIGAAASGLHVHVLGNCPPVMFDEHTPAFRELASCMQATLGRDIPMVRMNGATDARHFVDVGVPVAIIGSPGSGAHGPAESADIAGMAAYEQMLLNFLMP